MHRGGEVPRPPQCFWERAVMDAKKPSSIAKLAVQTATFYQTCEAMLTVARANYFPKWWLGTLQVRSALPLALCPGR